jgi:hypothetical protein
MMNQSHPYLPELDWMDAEVVPGDFAEMYREAAVQAAARGPGVRQRALGGLQAARHRITTAAGQTVLKATKNENICAARGHQIVAKPWVEVPGHYENWHRVVGCECGKIAKLQSCSHHQNPDLSFPKKEPTK